MAYVSPSVPRTLRMNARLATPTQWPIAGPRAIRPLVMMATPARRRVFVIRPAVRESPKPTAVAMVWWKMESVVMEIAPKVVTPSMRAPGRFWWVQLRPVTQCVYPIL